MTDNNNKETVNLSDLDILDQTTIEIELSGNEPSVQNDSNEADDPGEVLEIPEEENSEEEHDTELDPNVETNEEQLRYVFNTVEGEQYIVQGTSDGRVEMITLDQGGTQTDQEDSGSENESEVVEVLDTAEVTNNVPAMADGSAGNNVPTVDISNVRNNAPPTFDYGERATRAENDYQNILATGRDLLNLMETATEERGERINDSDNENGNQNPDPEEVLEIPDEEDSEEEHHTELENANLQAWENRSAAQKKYLEAQESQRKLIIRCMRDDTFVVLNRNDIPNWYRAQRKATNNNDPDENQDEKEDTESDSDEDDEVKFVGAILKSKSKYGGAIDGVTSIAGSSKEQAKVSNNNTKKCKCGEHTKNIGKTECSICRRQFLTIQDLQEHLSEIGHVCHEIGCQHKFGPKPVKRPRLDESYNDNPVYSNAIAPWFTWMPKVLRCLVDLPKFELSKKAHKEIRKRGLNLRHYSPEFRKYHVERLPVLVSGFDRPETTTDENDNDSKEDEAHHENCSPRNPCEICKEIKNNILKPSSEESDNEKSKCCTAEEEETSYLSSEESDTDWDDPHNGEHPNCTECEEIREEDCEDPECNEHGAGDNEGYEEPQEETERLILKRITKLTHNLVENHGSDDETRPINSDEAEEITEVIERLQRETEKASGLAANALKGLKATNETTQAVKDHLEKEMVKQAEAYRSLSTDYSQLSAENARVRDQAEKVKKDLAKIKSASQNIPEAESKWTHHHSAPGKKIKDFICMEEIEKKLRRLLLRQNRH